MSSPYAIVRTSGRQYHVRQGTVIEVAPLSAKPGEPVVLQDVLLLGGEGAALWDAKALQNAQVTAKVVAQAAGRKIRVTKFRRRKNYRRTLGHRQALTRLEIVSIDKGGDKGASQPDAATAADQTAPAPDTAAENQHGA